MTRYSVDLDELDATAGDLDAFQQRLRRRLDELEKLVEDLHLVWRGQAAEAHRAAHEQWRAGAAQMHDGLGDMHQAARTAHGNYTSAAESNRDMFRQTR